MRRARPALGVSIAPWLLSLGGGGRRTFFFFFEESSGFFFCLSFRSFVLFSLWLDQCLVGSVSGVVVVVVVVGESEVDISLSKLGAY